MFELKIGRGEAEGPGDGREDAPEQGARDRCTIPLFKKVMEAVAEIAKEAEMKISEDGLSIQVMDSMHVSLLELFLQRSAFESFRCDRSLALGIPLVPFLRILRNLPTESSSSLFLSSDDDASLLAIVCETAQKRFSSHLKLLTLDCEEYSFPEMEYSSVIRMDAGDFHKVSKTFGVFGETLDIEATADGVFFRQESDVTNSEIFFSREQKDALQAEDKENLRRDAKKKSFEIAVKKDVSLKLSSKYFVAFSKSGVISNEVVISLEENSPVLLQFPMPSIGHMNYYIAPRNEDE